MNHKDTEEQISRLKRMGWVLITLAVFVSGGVYLLPTSTTSYWLSADGKEGFYVLSALFFFLGFYCLGAIWRRRNFI